jgi:hypothetical protein
VKKKLEKRKQRRTDRKIPCLKTTTRWLKRTSARNQEFTTKRDCRFNAITEVILGLSQKIQTGLNGFLSCKFQNLWTQIH